MKVSEIMSEVAGGCGTEINRSELGVKMWT